MAEPISTAEAKKHLRVDSATDDALITAAIVAAREWVEDYTGLILTRREVIETVSSLSTLTRLRSWPVAADQPIEITYRDRHGVDQIIADASLRAFARPASIWPAPGALWPIVRGSAEVKLTAGYATPADIPATIKHAMLVMLTGFYEDREGGDLFAAAVQSARGLCRSHRRWSL